MYKSSTSACFATATGTWEKPAGFVTAKSACASCFFVPATLSHSYKGHICLCFQLMAEPHPEKTVTCLSLTWHLPFPFGTANRARNSYTTNRAAKALQVKQKILTCLGFVLKSGHGSKEIYRWLSSQVSSQERCQPAVAQGRLDQRKLLKPHRARKIRQSGCSLWCNHSLYKLSGMHASIYSAAMVSAFPSAEMQLQKVPFS